MTTIASQITSLTVVYSIVYSDADERKHQSSASLAFVWGIHRDRWIPRTKGQLRGKWFHLMTSSCNMSSPVWCKAIIPSNVDLLPTGSSETNFSEIWIKMQNYSIRELQFKMSSVAKVGYLVTLQYVKYRFHKTGILITTCRWLSAWLQYLQCVSNGDTAVLHWAIDLLLIYFQIIVNWMAPNKLLTVIFIMHLFLIRIVLNDGGLSLCLK